MKKNTILSLIALIFALFVSHPAFSASSFTIPDLNAPVMDFAGIVEDSSEAELNQYISKVYQNTGVQIAVLTMKSLGGLSIEEVSIQVAEKWGLGQKGKDNGVLLLIAYEDHELRIEVGYGLEGLLTDAKSSRIIRNYITPQFKAGNYTQGIVNGVLKITEIATDGADIDSPLAEEAQAESSIGDLLALLWFGFVFVLVATTSAGLGPFGWYYWIALLTGTPFHRRWSSGMTRHHDHDDHWRGGSGGFGGGFGGGRGGFGGGSFRGGGGHFGGGGSSGKW